MYDATIFIHVGQPKAFQAEPNYAWRVQPTQPYEKDGPLCVELDWPDPIRQQLFGEHTSRFEHYLFGLGAKCAFAHFLFPEALVPICHEAPQAVVRLSEKCMHWSVKGFGVC